MADTLRSQLEKFVNDIENRGPLQATDLNAPDGLRAEGAYAAIGQVALQLRAILDSGVDAAPPMESFYFGLKVFIAGNGPYNSHYGTFQGWTEEVGTRKKVASVLLDAADFPVDIDPFDLRLVS